MVITDLPPLRFSETPTHKERLINFDIGFGDQSLVQFSQGILINKEQEAPIFVTTGDGIKLAQGMINREGPRIRCPATGTETSFMSSVILDRNDEG